MSSLAFAAEITGTVTNRTTNKPSVGDDVILLKLEQAMQEVARTQTDAAGKFKLEVPKDAGNSSAQPLPYLIRVSHRNVNYHKPAPPGASSVEIDVFDAAEKLEGVKETVDVMRLEADATNLRVTEMFALTNSSSPPKTLMSAKSFEVVLPEGAQITQSLAAGPGGMPVSSSPAPTGEKNHYAFLFPIRPGETRFQIAYSMPYKGQARIEPKLLRPAENFAVSAPKSMQVMPVAGSKLEAKGEDAGMAVFVAQNASPAQALGFTVSGTGAVPIDSQGPPAGQGASNGGGVVNGPGGGLGAPVNTPDPLFQYRWWLIGGVAALLVAGAAFSMSRPVAQPATHAAKTLAMPGDRDEMVLQALKEEVFQLESDRLQERISPEDYSSSKAALDLIMKRVIARKQHAFATPAIGAD